MDHVSSDLYPPDFAITITFASDDDDHRQDVYDRIDAALSQLAHEVCSECGALVVAVDTCIEVEVAGVV